MNAVPGVELRVTAVQDLVQLGLHLDLEPHELISRGLAEVGVPIVCRDLGLLRRAFPELAMLNYECGVRRFKNVL